MNDVHLSIIQTLLEMFVLFLNSIDHRRNKEVKGRSIFDCGKPVTNFSSNAFLEISVIKQF